MRDGVPKLKLCETWKGSFREKRRGEKMKTCVVDFHVAF